MQSIPLLPKTDLSPPPSFSRWVSIEFLLDYEEMESFLNELSPIHLLTTTMQDASDPFYQKKEKFLEAYQYYIESLKAQCLPDLKVLREAFYGFWTRNLEDIYRVDLQSGKEILQLQKPFLQVQPIALNLSSVDQSIHVGSIGPNGILWGLKVSFPQLIQPPKSSEINPINPKLDENAKLFKSLRSFLREHSKPTTFLVQDKEIKTHVRLGKKCSTWIQNHPQLSKEMQIKD